MIFGLDLTASIDGTSLAKTLPGVKLSHMLKTFGPGNDDNSEKRTKGYGPYMWVFAAEDGRVCTVYSCHGEFRIGNKDRTLTEPFRKWLRSQIKPTKRHYYAKRKSDLKAIDGEPIFSVYRFDSREDRALWMEHNTHGQPTSYLPEAITAKEARRLGSILAATWDGQDWGFEWTNE